MGAEIVYVHVQRAQDCEIIYGADAKITYMLTYCKWSTD